MYLITIFPDEHKVVGQGRVSMAWRKVLSNGNYDYDDMIRVLQSHKTELGIWKSDADISEIVNVEGIEAMNAYMDFGHIEFFGMNHWYEQ